MNILAHLQFGDNRSAHYHQEYLVVGCRTHLMRRYGIYRPEAAPGFDSLEVTLIAPGKEDLSGSVLTCWMYVRKATMKYNGSMRLRGRNVMR